MVRAYLWLWPEERRNPGRVNLMVGFPEGFGGLRIVKRKASKVIKCK